jgi:hypothetical protein
MVLKKKKNPKSMFRGMAQVVEHLLSKSRSWVQTQYAHKKKKKKKEERKKKISSIGIRNQLVALFYFDYKRTSPPKKNPLFTHISSCK